MSAVLLYQIPFAKTAFGDLLPAVNRGTSNIAYASAFRAFQTPATHGKLGRHLDANQAA